MSKIWKVKKTEAGVLHAMCLIKTMVYLLYSKKHTYRGGKKRSQKKTMMLLSGSVASYTMVGEKEIQESLKKWKRYTVSADTPHLLFFKQGGWFIEWWGADYCEEKYEPFYSKKSNPQ